MVAKRLSIFLIEEVVDFPDQALAVSIIKFYLFLYEYCSVPGKRSLCAHVLHFMGPAASIQMYGILIPGRGKNRELCLSAHGHLPGILQHY